MQNRTLSLLIAALFCCVSAAAADRTTCVIPRYESGESSSGTAEQFPDEAFGEASGGWRAYVRLWKSHRADPANPAVRRFLGLPLSRDIEASSRQGRSAPRWLGWRLGSYQQIDTPHFTIFTRAKPHQSRDVAIDLEDCYWIWTQMFFPLWKGSAQVSTVLADAGDDVDIAEFVASTSARISTRNKMRVVLFRDANEYRQTLGKSMPGIERSTGFYNDTKRTTFLYAGDDIDPATRRHELVHQMFREATQSSLGQKMPGERSDFWLIEGIAGYFESLQLSDRTATVGGWDAPRLQFARYRMLVGGDVMSLEELAKDGRLAAQRREDITRWYAHAIAQTHHMMDRGDPKSRQWLYRKLAEVYRIRCDIPSVDEPTGADRNLNEFLTIGDEHLKSNPISHEIAELCLAGCEVTSEGLATIPPTSRLRWLDLSRLSVSAADVNRLATDSSILEQLSLEDTVIDQSIVEWLRAAKNLNELDLSWVDIDDLLVVAVASLPKLELLYLTGTKVTDESIDAIAKLGKLKTIDLQRTKVTEAGIAKLKKLRPNLEINPIEFRN